jgi:hypothetical protein
MYNKFFEVCEYLYEGFCDEPEYIAKCVGVSVEFVSRCGKLFDIDMTSVSEDEFREFFN